MLFLTTELSFDVYWSTMQGDIRFRTFNSQEWKTFSIVSWEWESCHLLQKHVLNRFWKNISFTHYRVEKFFEFVGRGSALLLVDVAFIGKAYLVTAFARYK